MFVKKEHLVFLYLDPYEDVGYTNERYAIYFEGLPTAETLNELIGLWMKKKNAYENEEITLEEYEDWKANFPGSTSKNYKPNIMNEKKNYKYHIE